MLRFEGIQSRAHWMATGKLHMHEAQVRQLWKASGDLKGVGQTVRALSDPSHAHGGYMNLNIENIEMLLARLQQGSLAHELVTLLKAEPRDRWAQALDEFLKSRIRGKVEGSSHAENQAPGD